MNKEQLLQSIEDLKSQVEQSIREESDKPATLDDVLAALKRIEELLSPQTIFVPLPASPPQPYPIYPYPYPTSPWYTGEPIRWTVTCSTNTGGSNT